MTNVPEYVIIDVAVVSSPTHAPPLYEILSHVSLSGESADLWKDRFFSKKTRFLCYRKARLHNCDPKTPVLVALTVAAEGYGPQPGYDAIVNTVDTGDRAYQKFFICTKYSPLEKAPLAIVDIKIVSSYRPVLQEYATAGEMNSLTIMYRLASLKNADGSTLPPLGDGAHHKPHRDPPNPPAQQPEFFAFATTRHGNVHPLTGVPFELNRKYTDNDDPVENLSLTLPSKTLDQLEQEYDYSFTVERSLMLL